LFLIKLHLRIIDDTGDMIGVMGLKRVYAVDCCVGGYSPELNPINLEKLFDDKILTCGHLPEPVGNAHGPGFVNPVGNDVGTGLAFSSNE
jgi:hypothetical protein